MSALRVHLAEGRVLFAEGDPPTTAFLIEEGTVEVSTSIHGRHIVLGRLQPGELLGEMAVLDGTPRSATAIAVSDCVLFAIDASQLSERLEKADPIIRALLHGQSKRYRGAIQAIRGEPESAGFGDAGTEAFASGKLRLEAHLREALANDGLDVRYQPLLHVASNRIAGYEALIRWNHPVHGHVSPMEFIALAEESDLIVPVGEYMFDTACRAVQRFIESGTNASPFVAVNVSARQLEHPGLIERIVARVKAAKVPRGSLKVEITESQALDLELVSTAIALCNANGISVALDDFGTGYSHLTQLHTLGFHTLKVDQAFSRSMLGDPRSMAIVEAIVRMGKALGMSIVVEGIENEAMLDVLRRLECDYAQGYLIGKPQTLEQLTSAPATA